EKHDQEVKEAAQADIDQTIAWRDRKLTENESSREYFHGLLKDYLHRDMPNIQAMVEQYVMQGISDAKYQVIVLDNITALQNLVLENIDNAAKDNRQNYQKLQLWFVTFDA
ncbi:hypothetical protein WP50_19645, partial [Lactiplantibacillus plantarum]